MPSRSSTTDVLPYSPNTDASNTLTYQSRLRWASDTTSMWVTADASKRSIAANVDATVQIRASSSRNPVIVSSDVDHARVELVQYVT